MIRSLRRRFIFSGMAAFGILLLILVLGITAVSYVQMDRNADALMQQILYEHQFRDTGRNPAANPARRFRPKADPVAYYDVSIDPDGEIVQIREKGIWEPDLDAARECAERLLASGSGEGKLSGYKYRLHENEDGSARLILMDNSAQLQMLRNVLRISLMLGLACLICMFLILLPISGRVVRSYGLHIEKQKQFITNAGHEIKTPVAIIQSNLDAMELIQGDNKWSRNIRSQTERLSLLLQRLLFMARIDENSMTMTTETIDLNAMLSAELESYAPVIAEKKLRLNCNLDTPISMQGNRAYLQQFIRVLMDNAVQYTNASGEIGIALERKRRRLRMVLSNTVEKLPDCPPEMLFDRFHRGDSARTQSSGGCGIGLSAARSIAEMHRGTISAVYEGNSKICFVSEFPL